MSYFAHAPNWKPKGMNLFDHLWRFYVRYLIKHPKIDINKIKEDMRNGLPK